MNLLELVQNVMSSFSLEEINSIEDVPEALQIAEVARETYYDIIAHREWEFLQETFSLSASGSLVKPNIMTIPISVSDIQFVKYLDEKDLEYKTVQYLEPEAFIELMTKRKVGNNIIAVSGIAKQINAQFKIYNDRQPEYYTSFDEAVLVFDAYNSNYDDTLQENKSLCFGTKLPVFEVTDDYEIDMPKEMIWSYLLPEVKSVASINLLQTANAKEEQRSRRGRFRMYHAEPKTTDKYRRQVAQYGRK